MINFKFFTDKEVLDIYKENYNYGKPVSDKLDFLLFKIKLMSLENMFEHLDLNFIEFKKKGNMYSQVECKSNNKEKKIEDIFCILNNNNPTCWVLSNKNLLQDFSIAEHTYSNLTGVKVIEYQIEDYIIAESRKEEIKSFLKTHYMEHAIEQYLKKDIEGKSKQIQIQDVISLMKKEVGLDKITKNADVKKFKKIQKALGSYIRHYFGWNRFSNNFELIKNIDPNECFIYFSNDVNDWKNIECIEMFEKLTPENKRLILSDIIKSSKENVYINFLISDIKENSELYALYSPSVEVRNLIEKYTKIKENINYDHCVPYQYSASVTLTRNLLKKLLPELSPSKLKDMFHNITPYCSEQLNILSYDSNYVFTFCSDSSLMNNKLFANFLINKIEEIGSKMETTSMNSKEIILEFLLFNNYLRELSLNTQLENIKKDEIITNKKKKI